MTPYSEDKEKLNYPSNNELEINKTPDNYETKEQYEKPYYLQKNEEQDYLPLPTNYPSSDNNHNNENPPPLPNQPSPSEYNVNDQLKHNTNEDF